MAYSFEQFPGDGSTTNFVFSFPYINTAHVDVKVDGTPVSFTWFNSTTVTVSPAPAASTVVEVRRTTPASARIVDWLNGAVVSEANLDLSDTQLLYITQEAFDAAATALALSSTNKWDAENKRIFNLADPVDAQDAVTKNYADSTIPASVAAAAASAAAAAVSETNAATSEANAATSETNAAASAAAAAASAATVPDYPTLAGNALRLVRLKADETGMEFRTTAQVLADIGAEPADATIVKDADIGTTVQGYDPDTLKADTADVLTAGFSTTENVLTDGASVTPDFNLSNVFTWAYGGNRTLNAPSNGGNAGVWYIYITVDGTGGYTLSLNSVYKTITGTFDGTANVVNILTIVSDGSGTAYDLYIDQRP